MKEGVRGVVPAAEMVGEDAEETALLRGMLQEAERYLRGFRWCAGVEESHFGLGVGGVVAVFLFRIAPGEPDVDEWLWVIAGDLPPAYLVTDDAPNPARALQAYVRLMREWVEAVRAGRPVDDLIPVNVAVTAEWADELATRLRFLEERVLAGRRGDLDETI